MYAFVFLKLCQSDSILLIGDGRIRVGFDICEAFLVEEAHEGLETYATFLGNFIYSYGHISLN